MKLSVNNLNFSFPRRDVLKGISLEVDSPGIIGLIGENGSGKSTLIRCLCGLNTIGDNSVLYDGRDLNHTAIRKRAYQFAYVPQRTLYNPEMVVYDYLIMGRKPFFQWKAEQKDLEIVDHVIRIFRLDTYAFRRMGSLSGGEMQKILIARSFVQDTPVIYLDEPTNNLDIRYQLELMHLLRERSRQAGTIILMAVHDLNLAYRFCDRLCLMHEGRIFAEGVPEEVLTEENLSEAMGVRCSLEQGDNHRFIYPLDSLSGI